MEGFTAAVPPAITYRAVARAVADAPGVVRLRPTVATAVLAVVSPVTDAPDLSRWFSRARVGACGGVRVRAVDGRAPVALHLCIDPSEVAAADRLRAAVAIASGVEDSVTSVLRRTGWRRGPVDITVHALHEAGAPPQAADPKKQRPQARTQCEPGVPTPRRRPLLRPPDLTPLTVRLRQTQ